jgi:enoyl-CoA hydratase/carnithine racemase
MGLVSRVVADAKLLQESVALAHRIAAKAPVAIQMTKSAVVSGFGQSWQDALAQQELAYISAIAFSPHDIKEAWLARKEKRSPHYTDFIPFNPNTSESA